MRVVVEGQNVSDGIVEVVGLIKQGLTVKGSDILVEVGEEEVESPLARSQRMSVVLQDVVEMARSVGSKRSSLLVAASIAGYEEDRDALDSGLEIDAAFSVQVQGVLAGKAGVFGVKVVEFGVCGGHHGHLASFGVQLAREKGLSDGREEGESEGGGEEGQE